MAKQQKHYKVHVELHELSDYGERVIETHDLERYGVSEAQVISRIRHSYKWYDHDNYTGSVEYRYTFKLERLDAIEGEQVEQLNLFDFIN